MYLTDDSIFYTASGPRELRTIQSHEILLVGCCNIVGELSLSLTQLIILHNANSVNRFHRRTLPNGYNNILANGLYNGLNDNDTNEWLTPNSSELVRVFDMNDPRITKFDRVQVSNEIEPLNSFTDGCHVRGLPIGVIVDGVSIYPVDVINNSIPDTSSDKNYFFRRRPIKFQLASPALQELEQKMITETQSVSYAQPIGVQQVNVTFNPLLD